MTAGPRHCNTVQFMTPSWETCGGNLEQVESEASHLRNVACGA